MRLVLPLLRRLLTATQGRKVAFSLERGDLVRSLGGGAGNLGVGAGGISISPSGGSPGGRSSGTFGCLSLDRLLLILTFGRGGSSGGGGLGGGATGGCASRDLSLDLLLWILTLGRGGSSGGGRGG